MNTTSVIILFASSLAIGCHDGDRPDEETTGTSSAPILIVDAIEHYCAYDWCIQGEDAFTHMKSGKAELRIPPGVYPLGSPPATVPFELRRFDGALKGDHATHFVINPSDIGGRLEYTADFPFESATASLTVATTYATSTATGEFAWRLGEADQQAEPGLMKLRLATSGTFPQLPELTPGKHGWDFGSCEMSFRPDDHFQFEFEGGDALDFVIRTQYILVDLERILGRVISAKGVFQGKRVDEGRYEYLVFLLNCSGALGPPTFSMLWDERDGTCGLEMDYTIYGPPATGGYDAYLLDCTYAHQEKVGLVSATYDKVKYPDFHVDSSGP